MANLKVTNTSSYVIGFNAGGALYNISPGASQIFNTRLEDEVQAEVAKFGSALTVEYTDPTGVESAVFVSPELELGVDFASGVQFAVPHGLGIIPTDVTLSIVDIQESPAGGVTVSLDSAATAALDAAPTISLDTSATAALDSAPTISVNAAGSNSPSSVSPVESLIDMYGVTVPTVALVHNADPVANLAAAPLFAVIDGTCSAFVGRLESNQASTTDTTFTTANDGAFYANGTLRATGFVRHAAAPAGVQLFVDEADSYIIKAVNATDFYIPLYMGGVWVDIKVIGVADTSGMKELYYDDNGADNAKLVFVATDTSNHNTGSLVGHVQMAGYADKNRLGTAAAQAHTDATYTSDTPTISVVDAVYTSDTPTISVTDAVYTAAFTGTPIATTLAQTAPADATNIYVTVTTGAAALKIRVLAI